MRRGETPSPGCLQGAHGANVMNIRQSVVSNAVPRKTIGVRQAPRAIHNRPYGTGGNDRLSGRLSLCRGDYESTAGYRAGTRHGVAVLGARYAGHKGRQAVHLDWPRRLAPCLPPCGFGNVPALSFRAAGEESVLPYSPTANRNTDSSL